MFKLAKRVEKANYAIRDPEVAAKVAEIKKSGRRTLELNIGDPGAYKGKYGFHMPNHIKKSLVDIINLGGDFDGYADERGEEELRVAVAHDAKQRGIRDSLPENVVVGNGLSELLDYLFGVTLEEGRNVIVPRPDYPLYTARAKWYGGEVRSYSLDPNNDWQPNLKEIEAQLDANTVAVVLINPSNPTGACYDKAAIEAVVRLVKEKGGEDTFILSDEIYHRLRFDGKGHVPTASLSSDVPIITMDGFSKGFYAPGWRIGHMLFSNFKENTVFKALAKVCAFRLSANNAVQHAYGRGLMEMGSETNKKEYTKFLSMLKERAAYAAERLNSINGIKCVPPRGAFYAFPQIIGKGPWKTDKEFILQLLDEEGVRVVNGSGFGMEPKDMFFRVVTLPSLDVQEEAYLLLEKFMKRHLK